MGWGAAAAAEGEVADPGPEIVVLVALMVMMGGGGMADIVAKGMEVK